MNKDFFFFVYGLNFGTSLLLHNNVFRYCNMKYGLNCRDRPGPTGLSFSYCVLFLCNVLVLGLQAHSINRFIFGVIAMSGWHHMFLPFFFNLNIKHSDCNVLQHVHLHKWQVNNAPTTTTGEVFNVTFQQQRRGLKVINYDYEMFLFKSIV